jgi:short-subunit dehydrogenase
MALSEGFDQRLEVQLTEAGFVVTAAHVADRTGALQRAKSPGGGEPMGKSALVTGASAGLGAELVGLFAADGHDVVLVARRRAKLDAMAGEVEKKHGVRAHVVAEDLTDASAPERIARAVAERGLEIEFLVNNAGFGTTGAFAELDPARELGMLQVNVMALAHLTRLFLPAMLARKSGRILNMGSTAGFLPGPFMAAYYASKAFVNSFTQALWFELKGTGVTATVSCPGPTATEFSTVAGNDKSRLFDGGAMSAHEVALHAYRAMIRGRPVAIPGLRNKMSIQSLRFAPRAAARSVAAALNRAGSPPAPPAPGHGS